MNPLIRGPRVKHKVLCEHLKKDLELYPSLSTIYIPFSDLNRWSSRSWRFWTWENVLSQNVLKNVKCSFRGSFLENRLVPNIRQNFLLKKFLKIQLVIHYAKLKLVLTRYYSVLFRLFSRMFHPQRYISWFLSNFEILKIFGFSKSWLFRNKMNFWDISVKLQEVSFYFTFKFLSLLK